MNINFFVIGGIINLMNSVLSWFEFLKYSE
jgi:hypothetical protein